jgi:hypothetical protein
VVRAELNTATTQTAGDPASFDAAVTDLSDRVGHLAPRLAPLG